MPHFDRYEILPVSREVPQVMHIDLNSCFATVEQQARPMLRNKPVAVTNRLTKFCCVITASYEAKARGVKVGMRFDEAQKLVPEIIMIETDPPKYAYVYKKLAGIMKSYSPKIKMKSIDEGVIDFHGTREHINQRDLESIGHEIKKRLRDEVGPWMRCNIGIAPNRFLAKTAASLHKPDGMDTITHVNLRDVYKSLKLTDLTGIAGANQARLNAVGIFTPIQFLNADPDTLKKLVFKSVIGIDWYRRLRGYEADDVDWGVKTVGRQYVLDKPRPSTREVIDRLSYLCETTGIKLRYQGMEARGMFVYVKSSDGDYWYQRKMYRSTFYSNADIYRRALELFLQCPTLDISSVREIGVSCYELCPSKKAQPSLFESMNNERALVEAVDDANDVFGEFTVFSANVINARHIVKQKIPFGGTRYFELLCKNA